MDFRVSCVHTNKTIIFLYFILIIPSFRSLGRSVQRAPPSLSGMNVMGIRNCVPVRLNATELRW